MFLKQLSSLQFLLRQGLAIRGHTDEESNLSQLLKLRCEDEKNLRSWLQEKKYGSPEIINECITLFASEVVNNILNEIRAAKYFSILADETKDVQNKEQLSLCLRWVDNQFCVHEDVLVFVHVIKTDSEPLCSEIVQAVDKLGLNLNMCRGQGYDGAANMSGHLNGVGVRIQRVEPTAIPVHCFAHCLNLCLQDA